MFSDLTDAELDQHRIDVLTELERRASLANIPAQVEELTRAYVAGGGDLADLTAITAPPAEPEQPAEPAELEQPAEFLPPVETAPAVELDKD